MATTFRRLLMAFAVLAIGSVVAAAPASAQATRTWVSGVGDDANPCSRTAPCKTFAGAISKTAAGGEINCLDPGGWGAVTITKSMTIDCTAFPGSILNAGGTGIIVNAAATDAVVIRGLEIAGAGGASGGINGVRFLAGRSLSLEHVIIRNNTQGAAVGVSFQPSGDAQLFINDSAILNNGTAAAGGGVLVQPTGIGTAVAVLNNVSIQNNASYGLRVDTTGNTSPSGHLVEVKGSRISGNINGLLVVVPNATSRATVVVSDTTIDYQDNGIALSADGTLAQIRVAGTLITGNSTGVNRVNGGLIFSYGDNIVFLNSTDGTFSGVLPKQ